jgi:hypothetical protein
LERAPRRGLMLPRRVRFQSASKPDELGVMYRRKAPACAPTQRKRAGAVVSLREEPRLLAAPQSFGWRGGSAPAEIPDRRAWFDVDAFAAPLDPRPRAEHGADQPTKVNLNA